MALEAATIKEKLYNLDAMYVLYSGFTNLPFIECDDETFDDQVYIFSTEEMTQEFAHPYTLEKILLKAIKVDQIMIPGFIQALYLYGVNAVMLQIEGAPVRVQLSDLAVKPDLEGLKGGRLPRANPELQLTGIYFMEELMRPVERSQEEMRHLHELEADMAHYLLQARLIVTFDSTNVEGKWDPAQGTKNLQIPLVKTKNGKTYQPIYTDFGELQRFNQRNKGRRLEMMPIPFDRLKNFLVDESDGFVFNPAGFNLILTGDQLDEMQRRYGEREEDAE